ncbi:MAG TPA: hypothetical protein VJ397_09200 [Thermoplasmata archaeon]|nr:hypothetical protein [Thermoplasmata archaeon]
MKPEDHARKAARLQDTIRRLDDRRDYEMVVETCYAAAVQLLACVAQHRRGSHHDTHKGLARFLGDADLPKLAELFQELESLRQSRFYGSQKDGHAAKRAREVLDEIAAKVP